MTNFDINALKEEKTFQMIKMLSYKIHLVVGKMAHTYNPRYSGGEVREDHSSSPTQVC
jgi:hypothetical protein